MNYYIETYGCQMNDYDSLMMAKILNIAGYNRLNSPKDADIIIINTCSVREKPQHKVYSAAGRFKRDVNKKVVIAGCVAQQLGKKILKDLPYIDAVVGTHNTQRILDIINDINYGKRVVATDFFDSSDNRFREKFSPPLIDGISAFVTIMEGCDNFCSYCIVPYVRGREISRPHSDILEDIEHLLSNGVKDITLLGQNVNSYGNKDSQEWSFVQLIKEIGQLRDLKRFRFVTSHPKDLSNEVIDVFGTLDNLVPYLHLPLQSASDRILNVMNRKYTFSDYLKKIEMLREVRSDISLTTDLIVGFPGETEDDFRKTIEAMKLIRYDNTFSFKYSPRPFTKSLSFKDSVSEDIKQERLLELQELQKVITREKNVEKTGKILEILVEKVSKKSENELSGRSGCGRVVNFKGKKELIGKLIKVKIIEAYQNSLKGEILE